MTAVSPFCETYVQPPPVRAGLFPKTYSASAVSLLPAFGKERGCVST